MINRLPALVRTTTFRLALVHAAIFIVFAGALLIYIYSATAGHLGRQAARELNAEVSALSAAYARGGFSRLNQSVIERSSARGPFFYLLVRSDGSKVSGDFDMLPGDPPPVGQTDVAFDYEARSVVGEVTRKSASGRMVRLQDQGVLMVAYDNGARGEIVGRVTDVVWTSAIIGLVLSLLGGALVSRWAAQRVEGLAKTTEDVMAGDLSRRAPVLGSGDEFDRLSERLNAMLAKLERLMVTSRHAGDAIAHDLRSPLSRLRNRLEGALTSPAGDAREQAVEQSLEELDAVLETFNAILRLSRVQGGDSGPMQFLDAALIADELAELYEPVCDENGLSFDAEVKTGLHVQADRSLVAQAVVNLLDNAVKYTPKGGALVLRARRTRSGDIELSVTDTGPGIPRADRTRVVERFVRLEQSRTEPGSGLGLSLAAAVADLHGGRLELTEGAGGQDGPGLRAALVLPAG